MEDVFVFDSVWVTIERVSVDSFGNQGNDESYASSISEDGRYVAFESWATNLVPGDTNGGGDAFVHDRQKGLTELVSVDSSGNQGNGWSGISVWARSTISGDGRYVAFDSQATSLVPGDTNGQPDVFVRDRQAGTTELVSVTSSGSQGSDDSEVSSISQDGRYVAFESYASNLVPFDSNGVRDCFVHDCQTGVTERVSVDSSGAQGNGESRASSISEDGHYVAFQSESNNLVKGDTNGAVDCFVHDRQTGVTERVSVDSSAAQGNSYSWSCSISPDGRFVVFASPATNLVPGDTNSVSDIFVRDRSCTDAFDSYCTAGISASGCTVHLSSTGVASGTSASGFVVTAPFVEGQKDGQFFYGQNGKQATSWGNGTSFQCVVPPIKRGGLQRAPAPSGPATGMISQDLNAYWCATCPKPNHTPIPGSCSRSSSGTAIRRAPRTRQDLLGRDRVPALPVVRAGLATRGQSGLAVGNLLDGQLRCLVSVPGHDRAFTGKRRLQRVGERRGLVRSALRVAVPELDLHQGSRAGVVVGLGCHGRSGPG